MQHDSAESFGAIVPKDSTQAMADDAQKPVETAPISAAAPAVASAPVVAAPKPAPVAVAAPAATPANGAAEQAKPAAETVAAAEKVAPATAAATVLTEQAAQPRDHKPAPAQVAAAAPIKSARTRRAASPRTKSDKAASTKVRSATAGTHARKVRTPKSIAAPVTVSNLATSQTHGTPAAAARLQTKESIKMAKPLPTDLFASFQTSFAELQDKARSSYEKSTAAMGEANDFAKGNVEALVESGKILAAGLQEMGSGLVAESRAAFETMTAEVKEMASVKTPADFFTLQSAMVRKSFDSAIAHASKNTEAMLKLAGEAITPLSTRVTVAVEKVAKSA